MGKIRFAVLGAGNIARAHVRPLTTMSNVEITAIIDAVPERTTAMAALVKESLPEAEPRLYTDFDAALADGNFDAVSICLPTWLHASATVKAAAHGCHVLCEKPMALSLADADQMIAAAQKAGVVLSIAQCRRYDNHWLTFKEAVQSGVIGRPVVWRSIKAGPAPGGRSWFMEADKGGGPLIDGAIHNYDFARYIFGEAERVYTSSAKLNGAYSAVDTGTANITFASGDLLTLSWSWAMPTGVGSGHEDILGPEGILYLSPPAGATPPPPPADANTRYLAVQRPGGEYEYIPCPKNNMYKAEIEAFIAAIQSGGTTISDGVDNRKSLAIGLAVLESAANGQVIKL
ncbi:MAG TPA: Gfo/Idh/MocA family oxidoreductase [Firmicutes bacterium]|nr:Gfo/Idh/MocA family oxidoreductase [Bacillota bacterium]